MRKQKIVVVTNLYPNSKEPTRGTFVKQLVDQLANRYDIVVIAPLPWRPGRSRIDHSLSVEQRSDSVEVVHPRHLVIPKILRFTYSAFMFLSIFPLLRRLKNEGRCDFISAHWIYPDGVASAMAAKILGLPVYLHAMGCDINEYTKYRLRRVQIVAAMHSANAVVTKSAALAGCVQALGVAMEKIFVVPNGVDRGKFQTGDKQEARDELGISSGIFSFLYVGNFNQEKNVGLLIRAFAGLDADEKSMAHLYLVGDGPEREMLEELVVDLGVRSRVSFLGRQPHHVLQSYYQASDCFALPSLREGCPNVLLEALACGVPVIASKVGGVPEIVTGENGVLVESDDHDAWIAALQSAISNPPARVQDFQWPTWEDNARALEQIFTSPAIGDGAVIDEYRQE
jgi:glycosyltransferase involved in cell wall biosynthesis